MTTGPGTELSPGSPTVDPAGLIQIAAAVAARRTTALAVTEAALARIAAADPALNAVTESNPEQARFEAAELGRPD